MTRYGDLFHQVTDWTNLMLAARKARRGKRGRDVVRRFEHRLEPELLRLQRELVGGAYRPGPFATHTIFVPKERLISAAPYRDRVVHHAVMNVLEPILDRHFHPDSFACRKGKGSHAAARRLQQLMRRYRFTAQYDVRKFFPSIDHGVLKGLFRRRLKDGRLLTLLDAVVDGAGEDGAHGRRGLPIGNLTSQWFANWYLDGLDHRAANIWRVGYVRYCDDFVLLSDERRRLRAVRVPVAELLAAFQLTAHADCGYPSPSVAGRTFVGFRINPRVRRLTNAAVRRAWQRYGQGLPSASRLRGWIGHGLAGDCRSLARRLCHVWSNGSSY